MLLEVRTSLLKEAMQSPNLLSDLAGLEQYIAESYHSRSFAELLQNADDAGASRFSVICVGSHILVANDGRVFTLSDFESLCRSASSTKVRGSTIGYRGIGFKSVVGLASTIHLFSGDLEATFSRERTAKDVPVAKRVPLIRIPHPVERSERRHFEKELHEARRNGYSTIFIFSDLVAVGVEAEFSSFDFTSLLFLRNVRQWELRTNTEKVITLRRRAIDANTTEVRLATPDGISVWTVVERNDIALAFSHDDSGIRRLKEEDAVVHVFLPTDEPTGLAVKINADVSTDPSRRKVVLDDHTEVAVRKVAELVVNVLKKSLLGSGPPTPSANLLSALVPLSDPRAIAFKRQSFATDLLRCIQSVADGMFIEMRLRPSVTIAQPELESYVDSHFDHFLSARFMTSHGICEVSHVSKTHQSSLAHMRD